MEDPKQPPPATWGEILWRLNAALPGDARVSINVGARRISIELPDAFPDPQRSREQRRAMWERLLQGA
jgi:hypothetical protein